MSTMQARTPHHILPYSPNPPPGWTNDAVMAATTTMSQGPLRAAAQRIDEGHYPFDIMGELGRAGELGVHLDRNGTRYGLSIAAMEAASRACGATGFLIWCHDVCGPTWSSPAMQC
jgi:alkylation response protein AidB-like acyl-CoA dehydrogenase